MIPLTRCTRCPGFLQASAARCPHCGATPPMSRLGRRLRALLVIAGSSSMALTLMACYGSPCVSADNCIEPPAPDLSAQVDMAPRDLGDDGDGGSHD